MIELSFIGLRFVAVFANESGKIHLKVIIKMMILS